MKIPSQYIINTAKESKALDAKTSEEFGIDAFTLMEVAGREAANIIHNKIAVDSKGLFLCGKGNNGGDALVAARYLAQKGAEVTIVFVNGRDALSTLSEKNDTLLQKIADNDSHASITFVDGWQIPDAEQLYDFIVDGMLGTGLNSDLRGDILKAVKWTNKQQVSCFAMDIPAGLHADSGKVMKAAVRADYTCSFGTQKQGFYLNNGHQCRGEVYFCELPFPDYLQKQSTFLIDDSYLPSLKKEPAAHKYVRGVVYIIGGSEGLTGAAIMAARSAWATGSGAVILICPRGILPIFENNLPQIIKKPVGKSDDSFFKNEHFDEVSSIVNKKPGTVLLGPGLGREESTVQFVNKLLNEIKNNCVVDADALWALARQKDWRNHRHSSCILTPHPGELKTLLGKSVNNDKKRLEKVRNVSSEKKITLLSKGFPVIIGTQEGEIYLSSYDSRHFSRAGFGDVLAGRVAAYNALACNGLESCLRGLLAGERKMNQRLNESPERIIEPKDII